jgi:hypothetical protein
MAPPFTLENLALSFKSVKCVSLLGNFLSLGVLVYLFVQRARACFFCGCGIVPVRARPGTPVPVTVGERSLAGCATRGRSKVRLVISVKSPIYPSV